MILYNLTFIDKNGLRTLSGPAQGRFMKRTREEAEQHLRDFLANNSEERIASIYGAQSIGTFRVDPFDCWGSGDPKGIYVDDRSTCGECGCELVDGAGMHQPYCVKIQ